MVPRPVFANGLIYVCSGFGDEQIFAIDPTGTGDVTDTHVKWQKKGGVPKSPSILVVGEDLFMVSDKGVASCLDALTGESFWKKRLGGQFSASPTYADGMLYFPDEKGTTSVVEASRTYKLIGKNKVASGERTFASFGIVDGSILLRSENHLYRIAN